MKTRDYIHRKVGWKPNKREKDAMTERILNVLHRSDAPLSLRQLTVELVKESYGGELTDETWMECDAMKDLVRSMVWHLVDRDKVRFTPKRHVELKR
jgi:hypothetical protein